MADERQFATQELISARYLANTDENIEPEVDEPARRVQPQRSGLEQTVRWLTPLVPVMLIAAAGGMYWLKRDSIAGRAGELKGRRSGIDLLLWASGSDKTFNEALSDRLEQARRDSAYQFDEMKPAFKTDLDDIYLQDFSPAWNEGS